MLVLIFRKIHARNYIANGYPGGFSKTMTLSPLTLILAYLIIINSAAFIMMRSDKIRAVRDRRHRIPERKLLGVSAFGGSLGGYVGMRLFRHKTKHASFAIGIPLMLLIHIGIAIMLIRYIY